MKGETQKVENMVSKKIVYFKECVKEELFLARTFVRGEVKPFQAANSAWQRAHSQLGTFSPIATKVFTGKREQATSLTKNVIHIVSPTTRSPL